MFLLKRKKKEGARSRRYPTETIIDADDLALFANKPAQAEFLLHSLERAAGGIGLFTNEDKTVFFKTRNRLLFMW